MTAIADLEQGTIHASITIEAPIERVYRALTEGSEIVQWWGSDTTYRTTEWTSDVRVGGKWLAKGTGANGPYQVGGEFLSVKPPYEIVQTWEPSWDAGHVTTLTYRLEHVSKGTRLTIHHEGFSDRPDMGREHTQGWSLVLAWLNAFVAPA